MDLKYDAIVEHYPMFQLKETAEFLETHLPPISKLFRFTIIRNPIDQFISYHAWSKRYMKWPNTLEDDVDLFFEHLVHNKTLSDIDKLTFQSLVNSQSMELAGYENDPMDIPRVIEELDSLDFVGIFEDLHAVGQKLRESLGWEGGPHLYFNFGTSRKHVRNSTVSPETELKIERIQHADRVLYKEATQLWNNCYKK